MLFDFSAVSPAPTLCQTAAFTAQFVAVAQTAVEDALAGFAYLPQKDVDIVRSWLHRPYAV